jgi:hypothetical protein
MSARSTEQLGHVREYRAGRASRTIEQPVSVLYDDGCIACDETGVVICWYYLWGSKKIPYAVIRGVNARPLRQVRGRWRLWGSGDFIHWYNLDGNRPRKSVELELDVGGRVRPVITPDDPDTVMAIISDHTHD